MSERQEYKLPDSEINEEFKKYLATLFERLRLVPAEQLRFLPSYEIDSPSGVLRVDIVSYSTDIPLDRDVYYWLVKNETGQIIATRTASIFQAEDIGKPREVSGDIQIGQKGKGLAISIDLVFIDSLQQIADANKESMVWRLKNVNKENLDEQKRKLTSKSGVAESLDTDEKIKALEEEQRRWLSLYGDKGKLGIEKLRKIFQPNFDNPRHVDGIDVIKLKRVNNLQTNTVLSEVIATVDNPDHVALEQRRREVLSRDMKSSG